MSEKNPFRVSEKRYNWVAILDYVKGKLAQKAKEETIIAGLEKQAGGKWTKKVVVWAQKCIAAKTVEEFRTAFATKSQEIEALKKYFPEYVIPEKPKKASKAKKPAKTKETPKN